MLYNKEHLLTCHLSILDIFLLRTILKYCMLQKFYFISRIMCSFVDHQEYSLQHCQMLYPLASQGSLPHANKWNIFKQYDHLLEAKLSFYYKPVY